MNLGSGESGQFTFLDLISIASFFIGVLNFDENLTQSDKQDLMSGVDKKVQSALSEIHKHLNIQDEKINSIILKLEDKNDI